MSKRRRRLTFVEFRQTGVSCNDLRKTVKGKWDERFTKKIPGRIYCGGDVYIEGKQQNWCFVLDGQFFSFHSLSKAEHKLYDWMQT